MARPRSDDPRSELIKLRVTAGEKASIGGLASAAGASVADFVRSRALGVEQASVGEARGGADATVALRPVPNPPPAAPAEPRVGSKSTGRWWCPEAGCPSNGESKEERCPKHGTLMLRRG